MRPPSLDDGQSPRGLSGQADTPSLSVLQLVPSLDDAEALDIAAGLVRAGGRALIAGAKGRMASKLAALGARVIELPLASKNPLVMRRNASRLAEFIAEEGIDVVHALDSAPAWSGYWATQSTKTPFITTYDSYPPGSAIARYFASVLAKGRPTIAVSDFIAEHITAQHGLPQDEIETIPCGADLTVLATELVSPERMVRLAATWAIEEEARPIFLMASPVLHDQGHTIFVEACALLRERIGADFIGVIVGDISAEPRLADDLEALAIERGCGDCVRIAGPSKDMPAAYLLASAVVSPTATPEPYARIAIEAQAMGRPVIASDHGGAREAVLDGETGALIKPGSPEALADAMEAFLKVDEADREELGGHARDWVRRQFSAERMIEKTLGVYERASGKTLPRTDPRLPDWEIETLKRAGPLAFGMTQKETDAILARLPDSRARHAIRREFNEGRLQSIEISLDRVAGLSFGGEELAGLHPLEIVQLLEAKAGQIEQALGSGALHFASIGVVINQFETGIRELVMFAEDAIPDVPMRPISMRDAVEFYEAKAWADQPAVPVGLSRA